MQKLIQPILFLSLSCLLGCSVFHIYQPDVQQGNIVEQAQINQLKAGMSKGEVRYILGSTILENPFDQDRWDYVYTLQKRGEIVETKRLTLSFKDDRLQHFEQTKNTD